MNRQDDEMAERIIQEQKRQEAEAKAKAAQAAAQKATTVSGSFGAPTAAAPAAPERTYEVKAGDTLGKIAKQFYGDANLWKKVFEANQDKLKNPDLIQVGMKLRVP